MGLRIDNKILKHDKYDELSKTYYKSNKNSPNISLNGGDIDYRKLNNEDKFNNNKYINRIKNNNFSSRFGININNKYNSNNINNINFSEPKKINKMVKINQMKLLIMNFQ